MRSLPLDHEGRSARAGAAGSQSETELAVEHHDVEVSSDSSEEQLVVDEGNTAQVASVSTP